LCGCALSSTQPVAFGDGTTHGIRVYDVKPLLFVYDTTSVVQFVPNYNRGYAIRFGAFLAKNDVTLNVENGTITHLNSNLDTSDFIKVLTAIAPKLIPPGKFSAAPAPVQGRLTGIYDFVFDDTGRLVGLRSLLHERVPPAEAAKT
jgi:hypothetical protein